MNETTPTLIEPGVKYFLKESLIICNKKKGFDNYIYYNFLLLLSFIVILGGILYYKYKCKLNPKEKKKLEEKKQTYFLDKIKQINEDVKEEFNNSITNLPKFENEFSKDVKIFL